VIQLAHWLGIWSDEMNPPPRKKKRAAGTGSTSVLDVSGSPPAGDEVRMEDPEWQADFYLRQRFKRARIPRRYAAKTLGTFDNRSSPILKILVRDAGQYIKGFNFEMDYPRGLLMVGPVGCGKSHMAIAILREIIRKGYSGLYYNSPDLFRDIRATFSKGSLITEDDLLEEVTTIDMLVFDDIGAEMCTDFVLDRFYLIINERYTGCKPVIITTNLTHEELESRLGKRIYSRIIEMCEKFSEFPDKDWRLDHMY
jgi:DNA replication protein DnaC